MKRIKIEERRQAIISKLNARGGITKEFFESLIGSLGFDVKVFDLIFQIEKFLSFLDLV